MREYKSGVRCDECGVPMPSAAVPLGGCLCDQCWDEILDAELVRIEDDECPGCRHGVCGAHRPTPTEQRLDRWTSPLRAAVQEQPGEEPSGLWFEAD
jgi:hypothetical protein